MSTAPQRQLAFDLQPRAAFGREDFLPAPCNADALAWVDRWPDWPAHGLAIWGQPGCGKTHLAQVWRARSGAVPAPLVLATAEPRALLADATAVIVEDADRGLDAAGEHTLFHLYNLCRERDGAILVTGREAPARWSLRLPDLQSRLATLPAVAIGPPDDAVIEAVLVKMFADRQLTISAEVLRYLMARMERSFAAARALVTALDRAALAARSRVTMAVVRKVLAELADAAPDDDAVEAGAHGPSAA